MKLIQPVRQLTAMVIALSLLAVTYGQVIPIDDFEDGNFDGWSTVDLSAMQPWGPGFFGVVNGEFRMAHTGTTPVPPGTPLNEDALFAFWDLSLGNPVYQTGAVRTQVRVDQPENASCVHIRGDLAAVSTYVLCALTIPPEPQFVLSKFDSGTEFRLWDSGIPVQVGEAWNMEVGFVNNTVSAKVWLVGAMEPLTPQYQEPDLSPLPPGQIILSSDVSSGAQAPGFADASFDNVAFTVPEPASIILIFVGLALVTLRR